MAWAARGYVAPISYEPVGPSSFPLLMATLMAAAGGLVVVRPGPRQL
jgi:putative tricarboxylic transport membrane protein